MFSLQIFSVGEDVIVLNHGSHWQYQGKIVGIDLENDMAMIRWETTRKTESVDIKDLQKYSISDKSPRKCKPTEFFLPQPDAKISNENMSTEDEIKNKFYSHNNSAKLCAEGSLVNLLDCFGCSQEDRRILGYCLQSVFAISLCKVGRNVCTKKCLQKRGRS